MSMTDLMQRPDLAWIHKVVPTPDMCTVVSNLKEKKGMRAYRSDAKKAVAKGREPNVADVSEFLLTFLYSTIVNALNLNRKAFKKMFYGRVGYIVSSWNSCGFTSVEQEVSAMWLQPCQDKNNVRPKEVPLAKIIRNNPDADKLNEEIFNQFMRGREELMITVEYDVKIRSHKAPKASASNNAFVANRTEEMKTRPFRRTFSILGVALSMISDFCGITNDTRKIEVLKFNSRSISVCHVLAISIKRMLLSGREILEIGEPVRPDDSLDVGVADSIDEHGDEEDNLFKYIFDEEEDLSMLDMMRFGSAESKRVLDRIVGSVSEAFWKENHISVDESSDEEEEETQEGEAMPDVDVLHNIDLDNIEMDM